jgi:2-oxoglutarate dehydrogenase dihydrolipoamide succinyltransferase (E2 component)
MKVEVTMPQMGVSIAEGTITEWRVNKGEEIKKDETICEISTDKIDVEVPSPASGTVEETLVEPGSTVNVGEVIAVIETKAPVAPAEQPNIAAANQAEAGEAPPEIEAKQEASEGAGLAPEDEDDEIDRSMFYSPVVQRMAEKHNIDLKQVKGSGMGGRIRRSDLERFIEDNQRHSGPPAAPQAPLHSDSPYRPDVAAGGEVEPMDAIRKTISERMIASQRISAHVTTVIEVDFSEVDKKRAALKEKFAKRGIKLTYLAFIAEAAVKALDQFPVLNASVDGDQIIYHSHINLGIAVDLEPGLIVPVIHNAQRLSLEGLAEEIEDKAHRAREGKLEPKDIEGATFTITNPGQFGTVMATPIINQPNVAILDVEKISKQPRVIESAQGDSIAIRKVGYLPLSFDHRVVDGAEAARFLAKLKEELQ